MQFLDEIIIRTVINLCLNAANISVENLSPPMQVLLRNVFQLSLIPIRSDFDSASNSKCLENGSAKWRDKFGGNVKIEKCTAIYSGGGRVIRRDQKFHELMHEYAIIQMSLRRIFRTINHLHASPRTGGACPVFTHRGFNSPAR